MYLVINLTVTDMLVGGISSSNIFLPTRMGRKILNVRLTWKGDNIVSLVFYWFPLASLTNITVIS